MTYNQHMVVAKTKLRTPFLPRKIRTILRDLKRGLVEIYGDQLEAVYLFGSFARGEGRLPNSDIDIMIIMNGEFDHRDIEKQSSEFITSLCLEHEVMISWFFVSSTKFARSKMPFISNVRKHAIAI